MSLTDKAHNEFSTHKQRFIIDLKYVSANATRSIIIIFYIVNDLRQAREKEKQTERGTYTVSISFIYFCRFRGNRCLLHCRLELKKYLVLIFTTSDICWHRH